MDTFGEPVVEQPDYNMAIPDVLFMDLNTNTNVNVLYLLDI